ncbi:HAD-IIA family hydrolase [Actinoplanes regularis]|uniref:HAD-superfamily subfamily IIA hydrolase, TIGR01458 n=1 Tax=Actinoplanes regularis TaxID=52697 RepID=A0A239CWA5_9ACTN|nr:HAD hydrolase-like protein [Actinoplanes regularis]GIE88529.1 hydrolase [Actinoplanes regularis]SNS24536.1 HAD-superfamily subfamily IIA hydrolase, TIGR01458 [Actinoplanes regularis]
MEPKLVLLDLDGTLHERGKAVPGAAGAVVKLRRAGHTVRVFTNTDSQAEATLVARIRRSGIPVALGEVFTPVVAAKRILPPDARVLVLADRAVRDDLATHARLAGPAEATHVVIGDCRQSLSYQGLDAAFRAVRAGAELLAFQHGPYFRAADGDHLDTGAIVAAIEFAAGKTARILGKPSPDFLRLAARDTPGALWVVGDDRTTDILMANEAGATAVQVRTGKYTDQAQSDDLPQPTHTIDSVADLPALLALG